MPYTLHKKVKDICQYLDLNTKIKANLRNSTKHLENFKISFSFCVVYVKLLSANLNFHSLLFYDPLFSS